MPFKAIFWPKFFLERGDWSAPAGRAMQYCNDESQGVLQTCNEIMSSERPLQSPILGWQVVVPPTL